MNTIDLTQALERFSDHWSPRIIAETNGQQVKLAKFLGEFPWHAHTEGDELFLVLQGSFTMEFRDRSVEVQEGQMLVVPRGVEHRPVSESECAVLLMDPEGLVNTGDAEESELTTGGTWIDADDTPA